MTGLPEMPGGPHRYRAPDFDTLTDSPILIGNPAVYEFTVDGKKHYLVNEGEGGVFDGARAAKDLEAIVREHRRMWGSLPYDRYVFLNVLSEASGGLEHKNSTVLMGSRWATRTRRAYNAWLDLASHEFFHVWNVKRLRPVELGPFDYENENHTRSLWIAEGVTDYYADLALHRAGLITRDEYLDSLSDKIEELQTTPGRLVQSAEMASFDAWIKYYRPDENSINTSISYYTKGSVVALLLDARVRKATNGARSLDDVMKAAYEKYSGSRGYTADEFRAVAEQVAGVSLKAFWDHGRDRHRRARLQGGARHARPALPLGGGARRTARASRGSGINTRNDAGRLLVVSQVRRDTPAIAAGLNVDDEILAIDNYRVRADRLDNRLEQYKPGDKVTLLVARREQLLRLELTFGTEPRARLAARGESVGQRRAAEQPRPLAQSGPRVAAPAPDADMTSSYVRVLVIWVLVLGRPVRAAESTSPDVAHRLDDRRALPGVDRVGRPAPHQAQPGARRLFPRRPQPAVVGGGLVGDGDAVERHHHDRHHRAGVHRRHALPAVLLRAAAGDDRAVGHAGPVLPQRARSTPPTSTWSAGSTPRRAPSPACCSCCRAACRSAS